MSRKALAEAARITEVIFTANTYTVETRDHHAKLQPPGPLATHRGCEMLWGSPSSRLSWAPCVPGVGPWRHVCLTFSRAGFMSSLCLLQHLVPGSGPGEALTLNEQGNQTQMKMCRKEKQAKPQISVHLGCRWFSSLKLIQTFKRWHRKRTLSFPLISQPK